MTVAIFAYQSWAFRYPDLAEAVPPGVAQAYFDEATLYLDNSDRSPVRDANRRLLILNMIVAHIAALNNNPDGGPAPAQPGRISSASEGSVSISTEYAMPGTAAWFSQTRYGAAAFAALAHQLTARAVIARQPVFDPYPYGVSRRWPPR